MKLQNQWPKGFPLTANYWDIHGTFRGGSITLGEYVVSSSGRWKATSNGAPTAMHECGHAVDNYLGHLSKREEVKQAYRDDIKGLDSDLRSHVGYWLPDKHDGDEGEGRSEAFAELFAATYDRERAENKNHQKVMQAFPRTYREMAKILDEAARAQR